MGMKRIRYVACASGWVSAQVLKGKDCEYKVEINTTGTEALIVPQSLGKAPLSVKASSPHLIKIIIKDRLGQLGVSFEDESRKKKPKAKHESEMSLCELIKD